MREMEHRCARASEQNNQMSVKGACAVCGQQTAQLVRKLPLHVKLLQTSPLHTLNINSFTSFVDGGHRKAHLGVCFECGDTASRAFNYLRSSEQHHRFLFLDPDQKKRDKVSNQIALFWLQAPAPVRIGPAVLDLSDLGAVDLGAVAGETSPNPAAELSQLLALLKQPWNPLDGAFRLDDYGFFLAVLSPNVGRVALREWFAVSLTTVKANLAAFLEGTRMVSIDGQQKAPVSVRTIVDALASANPNLTRLLLRTAYTGVKPSVALAIQADRRLNDLLGNEASLRDRQRSQRGDRASVWDDDWPHALAAAIKLGLYHGKEEGKAMTEANPMHRSKAYHCGRLLAVLEEAQQWHYYRRNHERLKVTMVSRAYGGVASMPAATLGRLRRVASVAHLPEAGGRINMEVETISATLVNLGEMPRYLSAAEQAEFGLGFYQQRARNRVIFAKEAAEERQSVATEDEATEQEPGE